MKGYIIGLFLLVVDQTTLAAEYNLYLRSQLQWLYRDIKEDKNNNPDNRVFRLAENSAEAELRPTLESNFSHISLSLNPRLDYQFDHNRYSREEDTNLTLRYWQAELTKDAFNVKAGQYVQLWGPSVLFSPSNRYHTDNGSTNPKSELAAREFVEATWYCNTFWDIEFIANVGSGKQTLSDFSASGDIRANWVGDRLSTTLQVSYLNPGWGWGGLLQWTLNDAWILYADGLYAPFGVPNNFTSQNESSLGDPELKAVAGLSYTFQNGLNLAVDYYYNGRGFNKTDSALLFQQGIDATADLLQGNNAENALSFISTLNQQPFFTISKNYAATRLSHSQLLDGLSASVTAINNLDDHSARYVIIFDYDVGDALSLFTNFNTVSGNSRTEFGRFFNSQFSIGLHWVIL